METILQHSPGLFWTAVGLAATPEWFLYAILGGLALIACGLWWWAW